MSYFPSKTDVAGNISVAAGNSFPKVVATATSKSTGSVASLTATLTPSIGDILVLSCAVGNATTPTITDSVGNLWLPAGAWVLGPSSAFGVGVFFAVAKSAASTVVTVNNGGSTASIACTLYDTVGLQIGGFDTYSFSMGTSAAPSSGATIGNFAPEYAFGAIAVGTAAQTVTVTPGVLGFSNDSGQQNPVTPAGLYSFVAGSALCQSEANSTFAGSMTSEPWAAVVAVFRAAGVQIAGTISLSGQNLLTKAITPVTVDPYGSIATVIAGQAADAFGRVRMTEPTSLFDAKFCYTTQPLLFQTLTVGTGTVLQAFPLSDGSVVLLGVADWLTPSGHLIFGKGITPDQSVALSSGATPIDPTNLSGMTAATLQSSGDAQLLAAITDLSQ